MKKCCLALQSILVFIFTSLSFASNLSEELTTKIAQLSHEKSFVSFSLKLTSIEEDLLAHLKTSRADNYNYYGDFPENKEIETFLHSLGNSKETSFSAANIISQKIQDIKEASNAEAVWVAIRSFHDIDVFSTPRWHTDGYMYSPMAGLQYKQPLY
ncbi:MAG: hypothetical protein H0U73_13695 [Tatlockia sp.]|nr:hypothetical protein [Tatlockia sp.]